MLNKRLPTNHLPKGFPLKLSKVRDEAFLFNFFNGNWGDQSLSDQPESLLGILLVKFNIIELLSYCMLYFPFEN